MGERGLGIRSGQYKQSWESSDFPILCETCLGENPYIRMLKAPASKECKICERPFTVFKWKAGPKGRYKKTEVCQTCAKLKNTCQTCLFDLKYGLPVEVRDRFLEEGKVDIPTNEANRDYWSNMANKNIDKLALPYDSERNEVLEKVARLKPHYQRNLPHLCSFFIKGECNRGSECPYRHELPNEEELQNKGQNFKERFYGTNDPLANKIINRIFENGRVKPPEDKSITALFIKNIKDNVSDQDLRDAFKDYGTVQNIKRLTKSTAIVDFGNRLVCEEVIKNLYGRVVINEQRISLSWARGAHPQQQQDEDDEEIEIDKSLLIPQPVTEFEENEETRDNIRAPNLPPPDQVSNTKTQVDYLSKLTETGAEKYPSMNPHSMGGPKRHLGIVDY